MAFASISTIALSLGVLGAFVLAAMGANNFTTAQIGRFQIGVFMHNDADRKHTDKTAARIRKISGVSSVVVRDRDKEWREFKSLHPDINSAGLPTNVLPYAMDVKVTDPDRLPVIASRIRAMGGIDAVREGRETFGRVMAVAQVVKVVSFAGVIMLLITTAFIISNAIRLTLYARRREIRIMQLVGATNEFIRLPLVIEGIVFGIAGAIVAWCLLRIGSAYMAHAADKVTPLLGQISSGLGPGTQALSLTVLGAMIGAAGSFVSIRRFLRD
jgi:cell division transport system permease protein